MKYMFKLSPIQFITSPEPMFKNKPAKWFPIMKMSLARSEKLPTRATFVTSLVVPART